jgi:hypothetical protein
MATTAATGTFVLSIDSTRLTRLAPSSDVGRSQVRAMSRSHLPPSTKGSPGSSHLLKPASGFCRADRYRSAQTFLSMSGPSGFFRRLDALVFGHSSGVAIATSPSIQDARRNE